jgi:hypothetical protein
MIIRVLVNSAEFQVGQYLAVIRGIYSVDYDWLVLNELFACRSRVTRGMGVMSKLQYRLRHVPKQEERC